MTVLLVAATLAVAAWLPFLHAPLTPDEGGFLLLSRSWGHGRSLYGDYWVDRPPLLLWLFSLAGQVTAGGPSGGVVSAPAVKLLGGVASGLSVLVTGLLASLVGPRGWPRTVAPLLALALVSSPFLGMPETDGEVLAVPFVLLGIACVVAALRHPRGRRGLALAAGAGACATAAALVKQDMIDVFVFAAAVPLGARDRRVGVGGRAGAFVGGSLGTLLLLLAEADARGTSPTGLWDAVVSFRLEAWAVIGTSASAATPVRIAHLGTAFLASGVALLLALGVPMVLADWRSRRRAPGAPVRAPAAPDVTWPALCTVGWEVIGVALGGSYWWHYLTGMVPGLVLVTVLLASGRRRRWAAACVAGLVVVNLAAWAYWSTRPAEPSPDGQVSAYLSAHSGASDGVVVAFGHPDIVAASGLASPYPYLWSLPVRVRDPRLRELERVLAGPRAPRWLVVGGAGLASWGLDAQSAQDYLDHHYGEQVSYGDWHVWERRDREHR